MAGQAKRDHDAREKKDRARITGRDAVAGKLKKQLTGRLDQAKKQLENTHLEKEYNTGIWLPGSRSGRRTLLHLASGELRLGPKRYLKYPELFLKPVDRIGIRGNNGSGKSSFIRVLLQEIDLPDERVTYIPQEISLSKSKTIMEEVRKCSGSQLGHMMTIVRHLGSDPGRLLESKAPSPGETRKLLLAMGMTREPHLIIMDEPTNHMDLVSIQCLEDALKDCPCCLILVSHDDYFLKKLTKIYWNMVPSLINQEEYQLNSEIT